MYEIKVYDKEADTWDMWLGGYWKSKLVMVSHFNRHFQRNKYDVTKRYKFAVFEVIKGEGKKLLHYLGKKLH